MYAMMEEISDLVIAYGGSMSGEHGDGLARSWLNEKHFGPTLYQAFKEVKRAFDPSGH
jgi:FAD/FMN-containing dehydrogenase